jgi:hypothetical protein
MSWCPEVGQCRDYFSVLLNDHPMLVSMGWSVSSSRCLETTTECFDQVLEIPHLFLAAGTPPPRCACHVRRRNKVRLFCNLSATITYSAATDAASTCLR